MVRKSATLSYWFGTLGVVAMVAVPVSAAETPAATEKSNAAAETATRQDRAGDLKEASRRREIDDTWAANHPNKYNDATVRLNGVVIMRLQHGEEDLTPVERARAVQQRLNDATDGLDYASLDEATQASVAAKSKVRCDTAAGSPVIYFNESLVVAVTAADASANGSRTALDLANIWAGKLREGAKASHLRGARTRNDQANIVALDWTPTGGGYYDYERAGYDGSEWRNRTDK